MFISILSIISIGIVVTNEIKLFANLCIKQEILSIADCQKFGSTLQPDSELLDFAQQILEDGRESQFEQIQELLHQAEHMDAEGKIAGYNPFKSPDSSSTEEATLRPKIKLPSKQSSPTPSAHEASPAGIKLPSSQQKDGASSATASLKPNNLKLKPNSPPPKGAINDEGVYPTWLEPSRIKGINKSEAQKAMIALLLIASHEGASDLHISAGCRIFVRHQRKIIYKSTGIVSPEIAQALNFSILSSEQATAFNNELDYDFALPLYSGIRFRVNLMQHKEGLSGTYRIIQEKAPSLEELGFTNADQIKELLAFHNGLILVTGPVGSGKTTTLAALIEVLNQTREDHIITVEDPIEIIQTSNLCQITQRGVGPHTQTFKRALKGALRQDPDIIVIGEMRDLQTVEMAISASETGHLVIATMHTSDAATTLNRLLDVFPPAQQPQIRSMVAESLRGIICQRLLPNKDGGLTLACELLLQNLAVSAIIREGKIQALSNVMETGRRAGMQQMDYAVLELWKKGHIDDDIAIENIRNRILHTQIQGNRSTEAKPTE